MAENLVAETFAEYGIGMFFLLLRLFTRVKLGGLRGLMLDDAFAIAGMIFWTMQTAIIYELGVLGSNIGLNAQTAMAVPESKLPTLVLGSKLAFMNWIWYLCYIWCLKGVMLCIYSKLTQGTWRHNLVWAASAFCLATWLGCILTHICICTPLTRNWQIQPYPGDNCTIRPPNYTVIATLNVLSDIVIILIPVPILLKLQIPIQRKIILVAMFSSGIFIMVCTILRAYYSLKSLSTLSVALGWADRECFVAAIVVSLPGIKPLFRNTRWLGSSNRQYETDPSSYPHFRSRSEGNTKTYISSLVSGGKKKDYELDDVDGTGTGLSRGESEEYILQHDMPKDHHRHHPRMAGEAATGQGGHGGNNSSLAIHVTTEYALQREGSRVSNI